MNSTTRFILPMIYNHNIRFHKVIKKPFISSYISDYMIPKWDDKIIIVTSENKEPEETTDSYIAKYKVKDWYIFVYDIPYSYKKDYVFIINNDYNSLSEEYKQRLLNFWHKDKYTSLHFRLYRNDYTKSDYNNINKIHLKDYVKMKFRPEGEIFWRF